MPKRPEAAQAFHALHQGPDLLILANAWDALSARVVAEAGARAVATSSAALAWAHGHADGHQLPFEKLVTTTEEIAGAIGVPLSVDMEGGYSDDPAIVGANAAALIEAGAIGINLEDGIGAPDLLCAKIGAVRAAAERAGVRFFVNARTDVFLKRLAPPERAVAETIARGRAYKEAGADGLFAPLALLPADIGAVVAGVDMPLNLMGRPGLPAAAALQQLGVRRLSAATGLQRAAMQAVRAAAGRFLADGDSDALAAAGGAAFDYNSWFAPEG
jgi:2-methylisocitrate lyase-like PEP mutase family enzyme